MNQETYSFINMLLLGLLSFIAMIVTTLLSYWASTVNKKLEIIQQSENRMSGALSTLKEWSENHDKQDDERHDDQKARMEKLGEMLHGIDQGPSRVAEGGRRRRRGESSS